MWKTEKTDAVLRQRATVYSSYLLGYWNNIHMYNITMPTELGRFGQHQFTTDAFLFMNSGVVVTDLEKRGQRLTYPQCTPLKQ